MAGSRGDFSQVVSHLGSDPGHWLIGLDFDGTLAPIVPRPEDARLDSALAPLLARLQGAVGCVAVISGRPRQFLQEQTPGLVNIGSYGLELPEDLFRKCSPERFEPRRAQAALARARALLEPVLPAGARLEIKPFGLVLHYRGAADGFDEAAAANLIAGIAEECGLALVPGRRVMELKPHDAVDKGWALALLAARVEASAVVFCGDDLGDIPAWRATRQLGQRIPALAVGIASPELAVNALTGCDLVLSDRSLLPPFLEALIEAATPA